MGAVIVVSLRLFLLLLVPVVVNAALLLVRTGIPGGMDMNVDAGRSFRPPVIEAEADVDVEVETEAEAEVEASTRDTGCLRRGSSFGLVLLLLSL